MIADPTPSSALRYLPVVDLSSNELFGFEVVGAGALDRRVEGCVRAAAAWRTASAVGPTMVIDVGADELHADLPDLIGALLSAYRVPHDALIVRVPSYSTDHDAPVLDALVAGGVTVAVREPDLRGAELGLLAGAPIDVIELPAALVDRIDLDGEAMGRVARQIATAHAHDWLTLARNLDRMAQVNALVQLGCELASGPAVGPLLGRTDADRVVARYFPPSGRSRALAS